MRRREHEFYSEKRGKARQGGCSGAAAVAARVYTRTHTARARARLLRNGLEAKRGEREELARGVGALGEKEKSRVVAPPAAGGGRWISPSLLLSLTPQSLPTYFSFSLYQ